MEYIDVVGRIIDAEQRAKALAEAGAREREQLRSGLEREETALRADCMARAEEQVAQARQAAQADAAREIARLDGELEQARVPDPDRVDYQRLAQTRLPLLRRAWQRSRAGLSCSSCSGSSVVGVPPPI